MEHVIERIEPTLALARERLYEASPDAEAARNCVTPALRACAMYLDLFRPPAYVSCNVSTLIKAHQSEWTDDTHVFNVEPVRDSVGDPDQIVDCLGILVRGAVLAEDTTLIAEVFEQDQAPCVALSFEGPGRFVEAIRIEGIVETSLEEVGRRWTGATRGGRIETVANGLLLRLSGQRMIPESSDLLEPMRLAIQAALQTSEPAEILWRVNEALRIADGEGGKSPADAALILSEVLEAAGQDLTQRGVAVDTIPGAGIPPILMYRKRLQRAVRNLCAFAGTVLDGGGALTIMTEYDPVRRNLTFLSSLDGKRIRAGDDCLEVSIRRAIVESHGGSFDRAREADGLTLTMTIPDLVGRELDGWIPGFETFSDRSKQALRLLKSGGNTPPEDFLLAAILEEELERWLLPRLTDAPAVNLAHDAQAENRGLAGSSPERLKKAFEQIKRGKVRKEIVKPSYAAEILYAFRNDERHRKAIGAERLDAAALERLSAALLQSPAPYVDCLRLIARAGVRE